MNLNIKIFDDRLREEKYYPKYVKAGDAGIDLRACVGSTIELPLGATVKIPVGFAIDLDVDRYPNRLPFQLAGMVLPRSGQGTKGLVLGNLVGLIDTGYQGQIMVQAWNRGEYGPAGEAEAYHSWPKEYTITIEPMQRFAQLVIVPVLSGNLVVVDDFTAASDRGEGGFGHTGED